MSPSHARRRGRIYRYYVTREAIADRYDTCAATSVPAADVESVVLDHVQTLLAASELFAGTWAMAKRDSRLDDGSLWRPHGVQAMQIRDLVEADWPQVWPIVRDVVRAAETSA